jgi:phosphate:Na+ symporter
MREIEELHSRLIANLRLGLSVFLSGDVRSAQMLLAEKERFRDLERTYAGTHLDRLAGQSLRSMETSSLHLDIISDMRRINSFFCSSAYPILEQAGQLRRSRLRADTQVGQPHAGAESARPGKATNDPAAGAGSSAPTLSTDTGH